MNVQNSSNMMLEIQLRSKDVKGRIERTPNRAVLGAAGLTDPGLKQPFVRVASAWSEVTPCNFRLKRLTSRVYSKAMDLGLGKVDSASIINALVDWPPENWQ